METDEFITLI